VTERIIVDTDWVLDPKVKKASNILMAESRGLMVFREANVTVNGESRIAVELELDVEKEILVDAIRRAGLTILENAEMAKPPRQKSTLNMMLADADSIRCALSAADQTTLNHPKLRYLGQLIREVIIETVANLRQQDPDYIISQRTRMKQHEIDALRMAVSKVIIKHIQMMSREPMDEESECPQREIDALNRYRNSFSDFFRETYRV
jgi:hypothetical protein